MTASNINVTLPSKHIRVTYFNIAETIQKIKKFLDNPEQKPEVNETYPDILKIMLEQFTKEDRTKVEALFKIV